MEIEATPMNQFKMIKEVISDVEFPGDLPKWEPQKLSLLESLKTIFDLVKNVPVKAERKEAGKVYVRTPARIFREESVTGNSADYAVIIASMLKKSGINYQLKMVGFNNRDFQHIYVIVPSSESERGYFVLDPQMQEFDRECSEKFKITSSHIE